ncbi:MAG: hypothetical protein V7644_864 [Actinomycetota bacterium]
MSGFRVASHSDLAGCGDGMQVLREGDALYVGHYGKSGMGTTVLDVSDAEQPRIVAQWPAPAGTHTHKVQVADGLLLVNEERFQQAGEWSAGLVVYDVSEPLAPRRVGRFELGGDGVHRIVWTGGRYAHVSATPPGFADRIWLVLDLADPARPVEAARWWLDEPKPAGRRYAAHHALLEDGTAYLGYGDAGLVVLDVSDLTSPRLLARLDWEPGGGTHTCLPLPGRRLVAVTDEQLRDGPHAEPRYVRLVDVSAPREPRVAGTCPEPAGAFAEQPVRFGPHNLHENRAGSYRSAELIFVTYFNAGLRVYDVADPARPQEVASWVPEQDAPQTNDLYVEAGGRVWVTDRFTGGLSCLEPEPELAELMRARSL